MAFSPVPVLAVLLWSFSVSPARAHSRWTCPAARNPDTGIKTGPCGSETNNFATDGDNSASIITLQPGPLRVFFEESIYHTGGPFRIALSGDGSDESNVCVLLDHIPHNDDLSSFPVIFDESTYTPYSITINIPNVQCDRCSLQLANPMTDKIGEDGAPDGKGCTDPNGSCFSVYHSCTVPFRIVGSIPRAEYSCPGQPADWPTEWKGDGGLSVSASEPGVYRRESSVWSSDGLLQTVPEQYRMDAGGLCGVPPSRIWWCFSGATSVQVQGKRPVRMDELMVGDTVLSASGLFTEVYSFGHMDPHAKTEFLQIYSNVSSQPLEITEDHMLYLYLANAKKASLIPARHVKVGDLLHTQDGHPPAQVTAVRKVARRGAYAPFTMSGSLLVNGIAVSNYIALPPTLSQGGNITLLSYAQQHRLQHAAYLPYRVYCGFFGCDCEYHDAESGLSNAVMFWIPVLQWLEHHHKAVQPSLHVFALLFSELWRIAHVMSVVAVVALVQFVFKNKTQRKKVV